MQTAASEEGGIHLLERDELFQDQGFVPRRPQLLQFLGLNDDMVTGRVFVPTDNGIGRDGPVMTSYRRTLTESGSFTRRNR